MGIGLATVTVGFCVHFIVSGYLVNGYEVSEPGLSEAEMPVPNGEGVQWMLMPDGQGNVQVAVLSGLEPRTSHGVDTVDFYLYTRQNAERAEWRTMNESCLPVFRYFKAQRKTKVLVHGFGDNALDSFMFPLLKDAYLTRYDCNVILVDWGTMAATPWYGTAARNTAPVGRHLARLIDHLHRSAGADPADIHLIGFSLGAHVVGMAGKNVKSGTIRKITALDPAQPGFRSAKPEEMLQPTDAEAVEVVHTSGGYLGFQKPLGRRDFYPNGGSWPQPGCTLDYAAVCSHQRAYYLLAEAIRRGKGFRSTPCGSWSDFQAGKCKADDSAGIQLANDYQTNKYQGNYYLATNPSKPFAVLETSKRRASTDD